MTSSGIEPVTFRFVAQHLNHCATAVPLCLLGAMYNLFSYMGEVISVLFTLGILVYNL